MTEEEKKKIAQRLVTRVSTGIYFIELNYLSSHPIPDAAWIRNIYILLSFYAELLLKAIVVFKGNFANSKELDRQLRDLGHNLEDIGLYLGKNELSVFGINGIELKNQEYLFQTDMGNFHVKDFRDIRYDFLDDRIRILDGSEHEMFKTQIKVMLEINARLKPLVWA